MGRKKFNMDPKKVTATQTTAVYNVWCEEPSMLSHETLLSFSNIPSSIETNSHPVFSSFPPQGIQFLLENDLLQHTPEDIAQFLYKGEGLNKTVIGDYLGERWDRASIKSMLPLW